MSLGYCKTFTVDLDPSSADDRQPVGAGTLPSRIKLFGIMFGVTLPVSSPANTVQTFQFFDGSISDPIYTVPFTLASAPIFNNCNSNFLLTDESYILINNNLSYEVSDDSLSTSDNPLMLTVFYV